MINTDRNKKIIFSLMLLVFVILISWTVKFNFLKLEDLKLFLILIVATLILVLLSNDNFKIKSKLIKRIRFNLFLTGMLMSIFQLFDLLVSELIFYSTDSFIMCLKPMIFVLIIYLPIYNILSVETIIMEEDDITVEMKDIILSRRENEVLTYILKGLTNKEISVELYIAENTVKKHVQNIFKKTNYNDRVLLINAFKAKANS